MTEEQLEEVLRRYREHAHESLKIAVDANRVAKIMYVIAIIEAVVIGIITL